MCNHIELNVHSKYSKKESVISPKEIVEFAVKDGSNAIAITDFNSVQGFVEFAKAAEIYKDNGFKPIYGVRLYCVDDKLSSKPFLITLLAKNKTGLCNMYKIISSGYKEHICDEKWPCVSMGYVLEKHDGILIGVECSWKDIYKVTFEYEKDIDSKIPLEFLDKKFDCADYVELRPWSQNEFRSACGYANGAYNVGGEFDYALYAVISHLQNKGKYPIAVSNANCITEEDQICWEILRQGGDLDSIDNVCSCLRTTDELEKDFSYAGYSDERLLEKILYDNPSEIARQIEYIDPRMKAYYVPELANAKEELSNICYSAAFDKYGEKLPEIISNRLEDELSKIGHYNLETYYLLPIKVARKCKELNSIIITRGCAGGSLILYLGGVTETNPLPPHYYCPNCKSVEFVDEKKYASGLDLINFYSETRAKCANCGADLTGDGNNIPYEFLFGYDGSKEPNIDFNVAPNHRKEIISYIENLFGDVQIIIPGAPQPMYGIANNLVKTYELLNNVKLTDELKEKLKASFAGINGHPGGIFIIPKSVDVEKYTPLEYNSTAYISEEDMPMTHISYYDLGFSKFNFIPSDIITLMKNLEEYTGVDSKSIKFEEIDIFNFFLEGSYVGIPTINEEFFREVADCFLPFDFSDIVKISGLGSGAGTWYDNAEYLAAKVCYPEKVIASREDIMLDLLDYGVERYDAYRIAEIVRKGSGHRLSDELISMMKDHNVPDWYIDSMKKIKYLFPKSHSTEWTIILLRIIWYKLYFPVEFYSAVLSIQNISNRIHNIISTLSEDYERIIEDELQIIKERIDSDYQYRNNDSVIALTVARECHEKGINILPADADKSNEFKCVIEDGNIRLPLYAMDNDEEELNELCF